LIESHNVFDHINHLVCPTDINLKHLWCRKHIDLHLNSCRIILSRGWQQKVGVTIWIALYKGCQY
jgi:hypothetical protein